MFQFSTAARNAAGDAIETAMGTSAVMRLRSGSPPANAEAARTGTVIATLNLPSDYLSAASGGVKSLLGTWQDASADANGTIGHFEIMDNGLTTCHIQGTAGQQVAINTNGTTAANGNVLNFAATTGVVVGMNVSGTGIPANTTVAAVTGTTVTLSSTSTAGVGSGVAITFTYDVTVDNATVVAGQQINVSAFSYTVGGA